MNGSTSRLLSLTVALLASLGAAQTTAEKTVAASAQTSAPFPADEAQVCAADENLLEVHVGATTRGTFLVRLSGQQVWLDPAALRPEEATYFDAEVRCGLTRSVRLLPGFSPVIDTERLTLTFQPAPQKLAGHSLTVAEPPRSPTETAPLFSLDYAAVASGSLNSSPSLRAGVRARYVNGPVSAFAGTAATLTASGSRWVPSAQLSVNVTPTFSVQLVHNVGYTGDLSSATPSVLNTLLFTGARLQLSNTPGQVWPILTIDLPFQAHLRVRIDGLLVAEYDVAAGPVALHDLPLHFRQGRIEVEIRDETGVRTVVQSYLFPGNRPGRSDLALDAGWLDSVPYVSAAGRLTLSPQVDLEASGRMFGAALQAQVRAVVVSGDARSFSAGLAYDSRQSRPVSLTASASLLAVPFTVAAFADVPLGDVSQTRLGASVGYTAPNYTVQWKVSTLGVTSGLTSTVQSSLRVSPALTVSPALSVRRDALNVGLAIDYHPQDDLTVRAAVGVTGGNTAATAALNAQYRLNSSTQFGFSVLPGGAALSLQYADKVRVDAALDTRGQGVAAVQGSVHLLPTGLQFDQTSAYSAFVTVETGLPSLQIYVNGQLKGVTDASGRLVFSVSPGRAVTVRVDAEGLPFDVTLDADSATLDLPGPGGYRLDWRKNFVRSRFVTFRWADGTPAIHAEIRFGAAETSYTDGLGTGFLSVASQPRRATLTSQDGTRTCAVTVPADAEAVTCDPER